MRINVETNIPVEIRCAVQVKVLSVLSEMAWAPNTFKSNFMVHRDISGADR